MQPICVFCFFNKIKNLQKLILLSVSKQSQNLCTCPSITNDILNVTSFFSFWALIITDFHNKR